MDLYKDIQIMALADVINETDEFVMRRIMSWYSQTYHTPLHVVETLPFVEVLRWYYEDTFNDLGEFEREEKIRELTETDKDRETRELKELQDKESEYAAERRFAQKSVKGEQLPDNVRKAQEKLMASKKSPLQPIAKAVENTTKLLKDLPQPTDLIADSWDSMDDLPAITDLPDSFLGSDSMVPTDKKDEW